MSFDSPSFIYKTPEQCRQRISDAVYSIDSEEWLFCNGLSSIMSPCSQSDEQDKNVANSWNGTNLHYRRRNRLETRLEELQKDVDCLSHKLRANVDSSMTLDTSSCLATSRERKNELESFKMSGLVDKRRNGSREQLSETARTVNSTVKALRQLKEVTAEKDQLKLELERTKRALDAAEKKCKNAEKSKKAYDKLKARCDLLQDSLQLSEKIRLRQKKVMKHLQVQQQAKSAKKESEEQKMKNTAGMKTVSRLAKESTFCHKTATPSWQELNARRDTTARKHAHTIYDAMDSCTVSDEEQDKDKKTGLDTHEQAPSKPTAAWRPQNHTRC
ncbi:unnamed protein product [Peronospora belbahrii]|uniref:Uncharacterized protein n=1 Tax=Peronospora belbahrii TaxID=622444 RepID=A0ABN8CQA3_9STRA|nr:unnamed protein product [Peronospora belbahrii]